MWKLLICLPTSLLLASGLNCSNYRSYYDTIYKVQTIDFNMLANSLPSKLSQALINKDKKEIQNTINSNYGYFGIVVTNCLKSGKECNEEKIIAKSQPEKVGWKEKAIAGRLSNYHFDLLRNPPPTTAEIKFKNARDNNTAKPTGRVNNGQIIGRVYYIRRDPPVNFQTSLQEWADHGFKAAQILVTTGSGDKANNEWEQFLDYGANKFYILTYTGAICLGLFIWQLWKYNDERRLRLEQDIRSLKDQNLKLNVKIEQLRSIAQEFRDQKLLIETQSNQISKDLERLQNNTSDFQKKVEDKDIEINIAHENSLKIQNTIEIFKQQFEQRSIEENIRILAELEEQKQSSIEWEKILKQEQDGFNQSLKKLQIELDIKERELSQSQVELGNTKYRLEQAEERIQSLEKQEGDFENLLNNSQIDKNQILELQIKLSKSGEELREFIQSFDRDNEILNLKAIITSLENDKKELDNGGQNLIKENSDLKRKVADLVKTHQHESKVILSHNENVSSQNISFSFQYYQDNHDKFRAKDLDSSDFLNLIERLKSLSSQSPQELRNNTNGALRWHEIKWDETTEKGFGFPGEKDIVRVPYQFSISKNNGRVHGFFINDVFYIVWLDPKHLLYSKN